MTCDNILAVVTSGAWRKLRKRFGTGSASVVIMNGPQRQKQNPSSVRRVRVPIGINRVGTRKNRRYKSP